MVSRKHREAGGTSQPGRAQSPPQLSDCILREGWGGEDGMTRLEGRWLRCLQG